MILTPETRRLALHGPAVVVAPGSWRAGRLLSRALALPLVWQQRASQRHRLESLDERHLRDIGLSRADAAREAAKPFWKP
jgi:uncharacterized protein YjiS (DUF1127 family)